MKKINKLIILFIFTFLLTNFTSCKAKPFNKNGKIQIMCTIFPEYDWLLNIIGPTNDKIIPILLIKNGVDLHNYQPSTTDLINLENSDLVIYIGGESDKWIYKALENSTNKNQKSINLMNVLNENLLEEEIIEGMQIQEESEEEHEHADLEYDEHIWLSLKNAKILINAIYEQICNLDRENQELYKKNVDTYLQQINELDSKFENAFKNYNEKPLIFADRFPFLYLTKDYNLKYYAAFLGCSTEAEASFETIIFLAKKLNELDINNIIKIDNSSDKLPNSIIVNAKKPSCNIIELDSMQSSTLNDSFKGKTYLNTMEFNLEQLQKIIN